MMMKMMMFCCSHTHTCECAQLQPPVETHLLLLTVSSAGRKGRVQREAFTCELFPSVVWRCMFGTPCSRRPYTGPYTWQCISVRTRADAVQINSDHFKECNKPSSFFTNHSAQYFLEKHWVYNAVLGNVSAQHHVPRLCVLYFDIVLISRYDEFITVERCNVLN